MAALHHKLTIVIYIYQCFVIGTFLIRSLCIDLTRAVLLGVFKSKFAPYQNVFIIGICTLDRMTVHVKDYILPHLYREVAVLSHVYIVEHRDGLSCCSCICSLLQRGILCFAYLGVVSGDNIIITLLHGYRVFIEQSRNIAAIGTAFQLKGALGISHTIGIDQLYGFLGTIHLGVAVYLYLGCGNSRIVGIAIKYYTAHANYLSRITHSSCSRYITLSVDFATGHRHLATTHEHAHAIVDINGSACYGERSFVRMIDAASSRCVIVRLSSKRTTTHVDSSASLTFSTIASDTSETTARKFATRDIDRSAWVADKDGSTLGFNLATLDIGSRGSRFFGSTTFYPNHNIGSTFSGRRVCKRATLKVEDAASLNTNTIVNIRTVIRTAVTTIFDSQITMYVNGNTLEYQVFAIQVQRNVL